MEDKNLSIWQANENDELRTKRDELELLKKQLVQKELELTQQKAELQQFENEYNRVVGERYAKLDELKAQLAELWQVLYPNDNTIKETAQKTREQARESAQGITSNKQVEYIPPTDIKQLYREAAKRVHPDFAKNETDRAYRTQIMVDLNQAYKLGNEAKLKEIIIQWDRTEQYLSDNKTNPEMAYLSLQILHVQQRLAEVEAELTKLINSDLYQIKLKANRLKRLGRNLLQEMAIELDKELVKVEHELQIMQKKVENCA